MTASSFAIHLALVFLLNFFIFSMVQGPLAIARFSGAPARIGLTYLGLFVGSAASFYVLFHIFLKRWEEILGRHPSSAFRFVLRFFLLSPVLAFIFTLITLIQFRRASQRRSLLLPGALAATIGLAIGFHFLIPFFAPGTFDLEKSRLSESIEKVTGKRSLLSSQHDSVFQLTLPYLTPSLRYGYWLSADFYRSKILLQKIVNEGVGDGSEFCREPTTYLEIQIPDCYFQHAKKVAELAPFASPLFPFYSELNYRQGLRGSESPAPNSFEELARADAFEIAQSFLSIDHRLELLEDNPMIRSRRTFLTPALGLKLYGSPEIALIMAGQDFQRIFLVKKVLPQIDRELKQALTFLKKVAPRLGPDAHRFSAAADNFALRIQNLELDPLLLMSQQDEPRDEKLFWKTLWRRFSSPH